MRLSTGHMLDDLLSCLFPPVCPLCKRSLLDPEQGFCSGCLTSFHTIRPPVCERCGTPLPAVTPPPRPSPWCAACLVRGARAPDDPCLLVRSAAFHSGSLRRAIIRWKYDASLPYASSLAAFLRASYPAFFRHEAFDCVLPVPLHPRRLRRRGFNQCVPLAAPLARSLRIPLLLDAVTRRRDTPPQSATDRARRYTNLRGAFCVRRRGNLAGRSVLIVDDVTTTGATLESLAATLLADGAARVCAFTLARTPSHIASRTSPGPPHPPPPRRRPSLDRMQRLH